MKITTITALTFALLGGLTLTACNEDDPIEEAGESIQDGVEDAGDAIDDAADEIDEEIDGH